MTAAAGMTAAATRRSATYRVARLIKTLSARCAHAMYGRPGIVSVELAFFITHIGLVRHMLLAGRHMVFMHSAYLTP